MSHDLTVQSGTAAAPELTLQKDKQPTVMQILADAVLRKDVPVDVIERLAKLQSEMMDRDAKRAYAEAFAAFKREVPAIVKDASIEVKGVVRSKYAKLEQAADKIIPVLLKNGITNRWKTRTADDGRIFVTCYLRHVLGHEEEGSGLSSMPDTSGSMSNLQGQGSTISYLERYTFIASCGIVVKDQDVDGNGADARRQVMASDEIDRYQSLIEAARTMEELKGVYTEGYSEAKAIDDKPAMKAIIAAYGKRKGELS